MFTITIVVAVLSILFAYGMFSLRDVSESGQVSEPQPAAAVSGVSIDDTPDVPQDFGPKSTWMAVPTRDPAAVAEVLELTEVQAANWETGLEVGLFMEDRVFVTPGLDRWTLAVGSGLPDPANPGERASWTTLMSLLSSRFGEAQYFGSHRVSDYSAWAKFVDGKQVRLFSWAQEEIFNEGEPTPEETDRLTDPEEEDVFAVAEAWGLSPMTLEDLELEPDVGRLGRRVNLGRVSARHA